tara:strand:+ start:902 stop:1705 length:804 start_codon:yes stop_codon:yes gene_type:complete
MYRFLSSTAGSIARIVMVCFCMILMHNLLHSFWISLFIAIIPLFTVYFYVKRRFGGDDEDDKRYIVLSYMSMFVGIGLFMLLAYPVLIGVNKIHVPDDFAAPYSDGMSYKNVINKARTLDVEFEDIFYSDMLNLSKISYDIHESRHCNWAACVIDADKLYNNLEFDKFKESYHRVNDFNDMLDSMAKNYKVDLSGYPVDLKSNWGAIYKTKQEYLNSDNRDRIVLFIFALVMFFIVKSLYTIELLREESDKEIASKISGAGLYIILD